MDQPQTHPLAIIGIGCLFPKADGLTAFWANVRNGADAISEVPPTHWKPEDYFDADPKAPDMTYARRGGYLPPVEFHPMEFGISPNTLEATDATQLLGLRVAQQALADAGYGAGREFDRNRVSVILGVTGTLQLVIPLGARLGHPLWRKALLEAGVAPDVAEDVIARIKDGYVPWQESSFPGLLGNVAAGRIANRLDLGGTNCVVDAACASSLSALHLAALELAAGRCDMAIGGGFDTFNDIFMYMCFSKTPALSPSGDAKPFDSSADGTALGEGLGAVVLKRLADARRDGDRIYAVIRGVGSSSDGKGNAIYAPSASGQAKALRSAYQIAGVGPETIELVEAHGTGTKVGDTIEAAALAEVYREARPEGTWCALGSVKSQIGHTKAAAGAAGLIKAALALHHKVLPPTIKVERPIPPLDPEAEKPSPHYLNTIARPWLSRADHPRRAAVSSFGFGGSNFHAVLEEAEPAKVSIDWDGAVQLFAFSGATPEVVAQALDAVGSALGAWPAARAAAARTRAAFRASDLWRLAFVLEHGTDPAKLLAGARKLLAARAAGSTPDGACLATGAPGKLALVFPGQGSQAVGMLRELCCLFPQAFDELARANEAFTGPRRLSDLVYPIPVFTDAGRALQEDELRSTDAAQPAIGAVSLGALRVLEHFGVRADAVAGHSFGELTALCAAGVLSAESFYRLASLRGRLMARGSGDRGSMLAVQGAVAEVEAVLSAENLDLTVANRNAPRQAVLSGATAEIDRAQPLFVARGVRCRRLPVAAAFHSRFVADARDPFADALAQEPFATPRLPVYANRSAEPYPADPARMRALLADQLVSPVEFAREIASLHAAGAHTFLEVGPGDKLTGLVKANLEGRDHVALALDARPGMVGLARTLAQLAALGHAVDLAKWDEGFAPPPAKPAGMSVTLTGVNYVKPRAKRPPAAPVARLATAAAGSTAASTLTASPAHSVTSKLAASPAALVPPVASTPAASSASSAPAAAETHAVAGSAASTLRAADIAGLREALRATQDGVQALQRMQTQAADLHRKFLEGQEAAQVAVLRLVEQQQWLLQAHLARNGGAAGTEPQNGQAAQARAAIEPQNGQAVHARAAIERQIGQTAYAPVPTPLVPLPAEYVSRTAGASLSPTPLPAATPVPEPPATASLRFAADARSTPSASRAAAALLEVVSEKTGYPVEMLNLDMGLDTDLGIDSIKRVEILSALQERLPEAPAAKPEDLGRFRTLRQIADFLGADPDQAPEPETSAPAPSPADAPTGATPGLTAGATPRTAAGASQARTATRSVGAQATSRVAPAAAATSPVAAAPAVRSTRLDSAPGTRALVTPSGADSPPADDPAAILLDIVAEKTGYPVDMLGLDMGLESDLGIDSIKRVEILSRLQERLPEAPTVKPEDLGRFHTLRQIAEFLAGGAAKPVRAPEAPATMGSPSAPAHSATPAESAAPRSAEPPPVQRFVLAAAEYSGEPGRSCIPLAAGARLWITRDDNGLADRLAVALCTRGFDAHLVGLHERPQSAGLSGLVILAPARGAGDATVKHAFALVQHVGRALRATGRAGAALLVTVSRIDGAFGLDGLEPTHDPAVGGLAGLVKTAAREWPEVHCKAIDLTPDFADAGALAAELVLEGPVEVGLAANTTTTLRLAPVPIPGDGILRLAPSDLVIVTGGARGVTAEAALALAGSGRPALLLLGRSPVPAAEPEWLRPLTDEAAIKKALLARLGAAATPKQVGEENRRRMAAREVLRNLERLRATGATVLYRAVDVRDPAAVKSVVDEARRSHGPVRGVVHGAGVLADRRIEDKTLEQFEEVWSTKVAGLRSLLDAVGTDDLRFLALYSSSTGRFGRIGQADYATANEALNKFAQQQARLRPRCRVVSINWGPWSGGMVTPALAKVFADEGVGLIPLEAGARHLLAELAAPAGRDVEVVVLGPAPEPAQAPGAAEAYRIEIDIERFPFLRAHVIDGKAVLPMAVTVEWLAHAAMKEHPGLAFQAIEELRVFKGVILEPGAATTLRFLAGAASDGPGGSVRVPVEMRGDFLHARATVALGPGLPPEPPRSAEPALAPYPVSAAESYRSGRLFHGPEFQGVRAIEGSGPEGIAAEAAPAPPPAEWVRQPLRGTWIGDPMALDVAFQLLILWSFAERGVGSLPTGFGSFRLFRRAFPKDGVRVLARIVKAGRHAATADVEFRDRQGRLVALLERGEFVLDATLEDAFRRNRLGSAGALTAPSASLAPR